MQRFRWTGYKWIWFIGSELLSSSKFAKNAKKQRFLSFLHDVLQKVWTNCYSQGQEANELDSSELSPQWFTSSQARLFAMQKSVVSHRKSGQLFSERSKTKRNFFFHWVDKGFFFWGTLFSRKKEIISGISHYRT